MITTATDRLNQAAIARSRETGEPLPYARREVALMFRIEGRQVRKGEPLPAHGFTSADEFRRAATGRDKAGAAKLANAVHRRRFRDPSRSFVEHVAAIGKSLQGKVGKW